LSHNTYTWYKDGAVVATKTGDPTYTMTGGGDYSVAVNNSNVQEVTLYSIQNTTMQDSLALIDLYNSTGGNNWLNNTGWATAAPVSTWYGITTRFGRVAEINLPYNRLTGNLPASLGTLQSLTILDLSDRQLTGIIPASIGNLASLRSLNLSACQFSGNIPSSLGGLSALEYLGLANDQLTGNIPPELGNLSKVNNIYLSGNQLSDTIPAALGNCTGLQELNLDNNQLSGTIPSSLSRLKKMYNLQLHDNHISGHIPDSICYLPQLAHLGLSNNMLTGTIPDSLGRDSSLIDIRLDNNNLSGSIKADFSTHYVDSLIVSGNRYTFSVLPIKFKAGFRVRYAPQQAIPLTRTQSTLSVSAGGNTANSTFTLFRNGTLVATQTGDSAFRVTGPGNYDIVATNTDVPLLTLYSDTLRLVLVLPDSSISMTQSVSGAGPADLNTDIFRFITITPSAGINGLSGAVTAGVTIDNSIQTYNGAPYVSRHYDITPAVNPTTAEATVTLYYTQADFDQYNTYITTHNPGLPLLPTNGIDNGNVVITQYHGSFTGTSAPGNYSQGSQQIIPSVAWDASNGWWAVSFPVSGFSGFYLRTVASPLPLTLLNFAAVPQVAVNLLNWQTADETGTSRFVVQRSGNGGGFKAIGTIAAAGQPGTNSYSFTDAQRLTGDNFYRLQMVDLDGKFTYSPVVVVRSGGTAGLTAYPNPAKDMTSLLFGSAGGGAYSVMVYDGAGRCMDRIPGTAVPGANRLDIDMGRYAAGIYTLIIVDKEGRRMIKIRKD